MRAYADTSFLLRLIHQETGSLEAKSTYRSLGRPRLPFNSLHELELRNAIRLGRFLAAKDKSKAKRQQTGRELERAAARLDAMLATKSFTPATLDWAEAFSRAIDLADRHTTRLGARSLDILHVAAAAHWQCDAFLTCDLRQAALAKAAGFNVHLAHAEA